MAYPSSYERPTRVAVQTVYFAYGSNLSLAQMAKRCPESRYLGLGLLPNFKWQINTRGYANVCISEGDSVEGLCFLLSQKDEKRLDFNEGFPTAFQKQSFKVEVSAATASIAGRRVREVIDKILQPFSESQHQHSTTGIPKYHSDTYESINAFLYINWLNTEDGMPRTEYISRISSGVEDAKVLGVPGQYFVKYFKGPMERRSIQRVPQGSGEINVQYAGPQQHRQATESRSSRLPLSDDSRQRLGEERIEYGRSNSARGEDRMEDQVRS